MCLLADSLPRDAGYGSAVPSGKGLILRALARVVEHIRRRPVLRDGVARRWEHALDQLCATAVGLCAVVTSDADARKTGYEDARTAVEDYRAAVEALRLEISRDPVAERLLDATLRGADDLLQATAWLAEREPRSPEGLAATWADFMTAAQFFQYIVREYLPLSRMSAAERMTRTAGRERLWLRPADIERTFTQAAQRAAAPRALGEGPILVMLPPVTDRRTAVERMKDRVRRKRRERLLAQVEPPS